MTLKKDLRQKLRQMLGEIPPEVVAEKSDRASRLLFDQPEFRKAEVVMVFLSLPTEVDTAPLVLRCWQDRKRVVAPKVSWEQRRMIPIEIRSLGDDLTISQFGIREPIAGVPIPVPIIDLVIVPGIGFDEFGNRLGRGRGFYDRFLAHPDFEGVSCALAFEEQVVATLPVDPLDRMVDMLVTDQTVRRFKKR